MNNPFQSTPFRQWVRYRTDIQFSFLQNVAERPHTIVKHSYLSCLEGFQTIVCTEFACRIDLGGYIIQLLQECKGLYIFSAVQRTFNLLAVLADHVTAVAPYIWLHRHHIIRRHNKAVLSWFSQLLNSLDEFIPAPAILRIRNTSIIKQLFVVINSTC
ncbi:hypothetical protein D3C81_1431060 [compost metagenome]